MSKLAALFEKLSDDYVGIVECHEVTADYLDLTFVGENGTVRSEVRLSYLKLYDDHKNPQHFVAISIKDADGGIESTVYVSESISAVIAVCVR